jgi:predicted transcriptional regulator
MQMTPHTSVGPGLRARRESLGLSREALGAAAGGISSATIARAEAGTVKPHRATMTALARALGCDVEAIVPTTSEGPVSSGTLAKLGSGAADRGSDY